METASLIGDPTRATILWTLMDGRAFTATELALAAGTSPQNISMHLNKMIQADLLCVENQGRHKYYKFSRKEVAYAVEALSVLSPLGTDKIESDTENIPPIKYCRTCYDHLAGKAGVMITDSLLKQKLIVQKEDAFEVSAKGKKFFSVLDIPIDDLQQQRRSFARPCLDWSERRHHLAGSLATALLDKMFSSGWIKKIKNSRAVVITNRGQKEMRKYFKISF